MRWIHPLCAILLAASAACASPKIGYDYDRSANFSAYRTYEWVPGEQDKTGDRRIDNSAVDIRLRTAVAAQLLVKGYTTPTAGQPDFYVAYSIQLKESTADFSAQYFTDGMAGRPFVHSVDTRSPSGAPRTESDPQSSMTGILLVDIVDASSKKLVWRGTATGAVEPGLSSRERDERIRDIVRKILSSFPPK